jgi:hypothetical protein
MGVGVEWWSRGPGREVRSEEVERGELKETKEEPQSKQGVFDFAVDSIGFAEVKVLSKHW